MTINNSERNDIKTIDTKPKEMSEDEERRELLDAIPITSPELTDEDLEKLRETRTEPGPPEQKDEVISSHELLAVPSEANITVSPYKYGGRLFFKKADGRTYSGSAEFVGELNILLTAAHCIRDHITGEFFTDFKFYQGYKNGSNTKKFDINAHGTKKGWVDPSSARYRYDYAFLRTTANSDGAMGYKTLESETSWTEFGYPENYGNNQIMQKVEGTKGEVAGGTVEMLGNPMRKGNSGGAWFIVASTSTNNNQAMGNQSFNKKGNTKDAWGPVFTNSTFSLLRAVRDA